MSRFYHIPNKVNLPFSTPLTNDFQVPTIHTKSKTSITIEHEKKFPWTIKSRYPPISTAKENTPPRRTPISYPKLSKPFPTNVKPAGPRAGSIDFISFGTTTIFVFLLDPKLIFNFIDTNKDARLSYLEFRSWMLIIDRTLAEHELLSIFNEIDRNGNEKFVCSLSFNEKFSCLDDGFIQYKEFRDYFGDDLLTGDGDLVHLTNLFSEIDTNQSGTITVEELLDYFNRYSMMISKEEANVFLGMVSDVGNETSISLKEFLKAMQEWKI